MLHIYYPRVDTTVVKSLQAIPSAPEGISFEWGVDERPDMYCWWYGIGKQFGRGTTYWSSYMKNHEYSDLGFINKLGSYCDMLHMELLGEFNRTGTEYYDVRLSEFSKYADIQIVDIECLLKDIDLRYSYRNYSVFDAVGSSTVPLVSVTYRVHDIEKSLPFYPGYIWWNTNTLHTWEGSKVTDIVLRLIRKKHPAAEGGYALFRYWTPVLIGIYKWDSYIGLSMGNIIKWDTWESYMYREFLGDCEFFHETRCNSTDTDEYWELCHEFDDMTDEERLENGWLPSDYDETC